jgi:CHAT domain-containing protein
LQVLQATSDSDGDPQVMYPLLQANLDKLDDKFTQSLRSWATAILPEKEPEEAQSIAIDIGIFSDLIREFALGNRAINLEIAITGYELAATVFTPEVDPQVWAEIKNNLGLAYYNCILGKRAENLEAAIRSFSDALKVYTREAFPEEWAMTQNALGNAYCERIQGEKAENLEAAIHCFSNSLEVHTPSDCPSEWAMIQLNLGNAYCERIRGKRAENLEVAIRCYTAALEVYTASDYPSDWAMTQLNLGTAYLERIRGEKAENLEAAIQYFLAALEVYASSNFPYEWAMVQHNLGNAYSDRIQGERAENLEEAIRYFCAALEVRTSSNFPYEWAETQNNLGNAYSDRIQGERAENLETAIRSFSDALEVHTREAFPERWANLQNNQGNVYLNRIWGERAENLEAAIRCFLNALEVYTRDAFPEKWAMTQNNLAIVYSDRSRGERAENLEAAIQYFLAALEVYTRDAFPQDWAMTQNNLGTAYCERIGGERPENLEAAIRCFLDALEVCTRDAFPEQWGETQNNLGLAYFYRIRDEKAKNVEAAIRCHQAALEVYTCNAFPGQWATTKNNLGLGYLYRIWGEKAENLETAIRCFQAALEVHTREAFPENHAKTQFGLGLAYQKVRQFHNAYNAYAAAISTVESLRVEIVSGSGIEQDKKKLAEQWNILYQNIMEVCLELAKDEPKYYAKAIEYVERSKARNLVELLTNKNIYPKRDYYPNQEDYQTHCHQLDQLRREIPAKQRQLEILTISRESEKRYRDEIEQRRQELNHLQQHRDELLGEIHQLDSSFTFTQNVEPIPFEDIQKLLPDNQTAIIQWYILDDRFLTFIITQSSVLDPWQSEPADLQALNRWLDEYLQDYAQPLKTHWRDSLESRLHQLAEILHLEDILKRVPDNCQQVILIPYRLLHLLPLHAMPLPNQQDKCLLNKFPKGVHYAPSCQLLQLTQKQERPYLTHLFGIQNPTQDLTYASLQVQTIRQHFDSAQVLVETAATKAALINDNTYAKQLRSAHCLHFACHGDFNEKSPLESYLKLANNELLSLGEIFSLGINQCRLVTLSACETGLTDHTSISDEYIGLPSGFLFAGSPSVVSSLWKVDELATAFLMIKFYENLRKRSKREVGDVAIALNQAQIWLRDLTHEDFEKCLDEFMPQIEEILAKLSKGKRLIAQNSLKQVRDRQPRPFASPYYWAGFIATGR